MKAFLFRMAMIVWAVGSALASQDATGDAPPAVTLPPELQRVLTDYETAWRKGDGAALARLFADDGFVLPNGAPAVSGRAAIQHYYKGPGGLLVLHAFAYGRDGRVGYIIGGFAREAGQPDVGKFTLTLRRDARGWWWIVSDMDNGNAPRHPH